MFGLVNEWIRLVSMAGAAVTRSLLPPKSIGERPGGDSSPRVARDSPARAGAARAARRADA
jgi:hypothetical protein